MSDAGEKSALYGSTSGVLALLGITKIGAATCSLGIKTLAVLGLVSNPVTAAIAGGAVVATAVYTLTKLTEPKLKD